MSSTGQVSQILQAPPLQVTREPKGMTMTIFVPASGHWTSMDPVAQASFDMHPTLTPRPFLKDYSNKASSAHASFLQAVLLQQLQLDAEWLGSLAAACYHGTHGFSPANQLSLGGILLYRLVAKQVLTTKAHRSNYSAIEILSSSRYHA